VPSPLPTDAHDRARTIVLGLLDAIDCSMHASVLIADDDRPVTVLTTDERIGSRLDGDGPTIIALTGRISRVPTVQRTDEFPAYVMACRSCGVGSVAAVPISAGPETIGVLTVTSADHHGFATSDLRAVRHAAEELAPIISQFAETGGVSGTAALAESR